MNVCTELNPWWWDIWCQENDKGRIVGWGLAKLHRGLRDDPLSEFHAIRWTTRNSAQMHADRRNKLARARLRAPTGD